MIFLLILGRDFLQTYKIIIVCEAFGNKTSSTYVQNKLQLFSEITFIKVDELSNISSDIDVSNFVMDFRSATDAKYIYISVVNS